MASKSGKKKNKMKRNSSETSMEQMLTDVSSLSPRKKSKKVSTDEGWEDAVTKARGKPDGASDSLQDENNPKNNGTKFEKGKKKPLNIIKTAAKKLKSISKQEDKEDDQNKIGAKRKHASGDDSSGGEKKAKIEELTFKERKKQRKTQKTNYDDAIKAKVLWEKLRRQDLKPEKRKEVTDELYSLIKGRAKELIFAHDTCRVIQCLMKYGQQEHRDALFEELRENILEMSKSKYAKFFVRKLLKYGSKSQRAFVFKSMHGNVRKLIKHREAAEIIELAYNDYANAQQRSALVEEFYGPSFGLFKTEEARTIEQIMASNPEKRDSILSNMKEALASLINKNLCQYTIVHRIFLEYFNFATEKARAEMIELVRENLIHMLHTREGARITMHCIWSGTAKDRKVIVKSMKTFVVKICKEEFGHLALLAIFDVVDDTKLVQKAILEEMFKSVDDVAQDQYGRKVLLYLLAPRDSAHFHPDVIKILQTGDANVTSKKDSSVRRTELLTAVSQPLLKFVASHTKELVMNNAALLLLIAVLKHAQGDKTSCYKAVAKIASENFVAGSLENFHIVEHPVGHLALKRLIIHDKERLKDGQSADFSEVLVDSVSESNFKAWAACNRGCFIIVSLLELEVPDITSCMKRALNPVEDSLKKMTFKGAQILLSKLKT